MPAVSRVAVHLAVKIVSARIGNGLPIVFIEAVIHQQVVPGGHGCVEVFVHPFGNRSSVERCIKDGELVDAAIVKIRPACGSAKRELGDTGHWVVEVGARMPEVSIEVDLHDTKAGVFYKGPVVPPSLVISRVGLLVYAVVSAVPSAIPVNSAVAPGCVHVQHTLVLCIHTFKHGSVLRLHRITKLPERNGDLVRQTLKCRSRNTHLITPVEVKVAVITGTRDGLACTSAIAHQGGGEGCRITGMGKFNQQVGDTIPNKGCMQHQVGPARSRDAKVELVVGGQALIRKTIQHADCRVGHTNLKARERIHRTVGIEGYFVDGTLCIKTGSHELFRRP